MLNLHELGHLLTFCGLAFIIALFSQCMQYTKKERIVLLKLEETRLIGMQKNIVSKSTKINTISNLRVSSLILLPIRFGIKWLDSCKLKM